MDNGTARGEGFAPLPEHFTDVATSVTRCACLDLVCEEDGEQLLFCDGFDEAIAGVVEAFGQPPRVCYDVRRMIGVLQADGLSYADAVEYLEFNVFGAYRPRLLVSAVGDPFGSPSRAVPPSYHAVGIPIAGNRRTLVRIAHCKACSRRMGPPGLCSASTC